MTEADAKSIFYGNRSLSLGEACQLPSIVDDEGVIHTSAKEVAEAFRNHWKSVFSATDCDDGKLREWMDQLSLAPVRVLG